MKSKKQLENRIKDLIEYIRQLGAIADVCTFNITREICEDCQCKRKGIK